MLIPIRCFTCGKVLGNKYQPYLDMIANGKTNEEALHDLQLIRYCCTRIMLAHVDMFNHILMPKNGSIKK